MSESDVPCAEGPEKSVLSWLMKDPERFFPRAFSDGIGPQHFWRYRRLAEILFERYRSGRTIELVAFAEEEHHAGRLEDIGGTAILSDVYGYGVGGGAYWSDHVSILRDRLALRIAQDASRTLSGVLTGEDASKAAADALEAITASIRGPRSAKTGRDAARDFAEYFQRLLDSGDLPGRPTGIMQLDLISGGMREGELWVVCGRPSRGKSVLMLQIASHLVEQDATVAVFSLEMMANKVVGRMISCIGGIRHDALTKPRTGQPLTEHEAGKIKRMTKLLAESRLWIDDRAGQTLADIEGEATRIRDTAGKIDLVVVDYLQLVSGERRRNESRQEELARVSSGLKQLSKKLGCPVLTGSQLNDSGQVRESRAIEQDADALLFIVEDGVKVVKLRDGQRNDTLPIFLNGPMQRFDTEQHQDALRA